MKIPTTQEAKEAATVLSWLMALIIFVILLEIFFPVPAEYDGPISYYMKDGQPHCQKEGFSEKQYAFCVDLLGIRR